MRRHVLQNLPAWLTRSPWGALCFTVLLAAFVLVFEARNFKRESDFTARLTLEKGASLITTLESALQTGAGFHWSDEELRSLVERVEADGDIRALTLADGKGRILLSAGETPGDAPLFSVPPAGGLQGQVVASDGAQRFRVSRKISLGEPREAEHENHSRNARRSVLSPTGIADPLWIAVDYDMAAINAARQADRIHMGIIAAMLLFLAFLGVITWLLVRNYMRSREIVRETTAFAGHILRTLPVGVIAVDMEGRITSANPEALRIMDASAKYGPNNSMPHALPPAWEPVLSSLRAGTPVLDMEMRCSFGHGRALPLSISASPLTTEEGRCMGYVFIVRDLGEIRRLQAELRRRDRLAALGTLAAGVAHEVRNPLSAIKGIARYFEECRPENSEDKELARTLGQEVLRLDKVVGDLLDLARPDAPRRAPVALDALVERARRMTRPALETSGVDFAVELPAPAPVLLMDADRLTQVLINLFLNAVEAMNGREARLLTVRGRIENHGSETMLHLDVEDTGCGIPPDRAQDVFSPYFTTKARGTGLGLSIVHKIIEAHGGDIEVKNGKHGGCLMSLRLPTAVE